LLPGQSVIHTYEAFRYPGTLTAYGLKDWFAHAHRLTNEREMLGQLVEHPWTGPTAAIVFPEELRLDSTYFDFFSIRYIFAAELAVEGFSRQESHVLLGPGEKVTQSFQLDQSTIVSGVQVLTAAYGPGVDPDCGLTAVLMSSDKLRIAVQSNPKESIEHHRWTTFLFEEEQRLEAGEYLLQLEALGPPETKPLVIGASPKSDRYRGGAIQSAKTGESGDLAFRVLGKQPSKMEGWEIQRSEAGLILYENLEVPPGAFLVASKVGSEDGTLTRIWWDNLEVLKRERERIEYEVNCTESCWLVQSDRYWPGWVVYVDGVEATADSISGLLPAVAVPVGEHKVSWRYEPQTWSYGWKISLLILLLLLGCTVVTRASYSSLD
jgi:hypothetical protein